MSVEFYFESKIKPSSSSSIITASNYPSQELKTLNKSYISTNNGLSLIDDDSQSLRGNTRNTISSANIKHSLPVLKKGRETNKLKQLPIYFIHIYKSGGK